jgi:hypothetical protein
LQNSLLPMINRQCTLTHTNQGSAPSRLYPCQFASIRGFILKLGILANRDMVRL